jgi:HAD superfamily hydrolase (TIGR01484 family)
MTENTFQHQISSSHNIPLGIPELIIFDLDGTLAESKAPLDIEMAKLLSNVLKKTKVAVISGASFPQFEQQFLHHLVCSKKELSNLSILPVNGSSYFAYKSSFFGGGHWKPMYQKMLTHDEKEKIKDAIALALIHASKEIPLSIPPITYGEQIEDRKSQITFSALGQHAPLANKALWDTNHKKREAIVRALRPALPDFEITIGGTTSIDITKGGLNKKYGIETIVQALGIPLSESLYIGDSLFVGGNDYAAIEAGIRTFPVKNVTATKAYLRSILG